MRGQSIHVAGSVLARPNGRFTAVTPPVPERFTGRRRRSSLGTFDTAEKALAELGRANLGGFAQTTPPLLGRVSEMTLEEYLTRWVLGLAGEEREGRIVHATRRDYEQVVRKHLIPDLGRVRLGDLRRRRGTWTTSPRRM